MGAIIINVVYLDLSLKLNLYFTCKRNAEVILGLILKQPFAQQPTMALPC